MSDDPIGWGPASETDPLVQSLRGALGREADRTAPGRDGLRRIRAEIEARQRAAAITRRRRLTLLAAGVAGVLLTGGLATALNRAGRGDDSIGISSTPTAVAHPSPSTGPSTAASAGPGPTPSSAVARPGLPVYYAGRLSQADQLFREFHPFTGSAGIAERVQAAVSQAMSRRPDDPDYQTLWAAGADARTRVGPDLITIVLNEAAAGGTAVGAGSLPTEGRVIDQQHVDAAALQQLIWTATAAAAPAGTTGPSLVRIMAEGPTPNRFGSVSLSQPFRRGDQPGNRDPRALVWIDSLGQDAAVPVGPLTVRGQSTGAVLGLTWSLTLDGRTVDSGSITPTAAGGGRLGVGVRGQWTTTITLPSPGRYRLSVTLDLDDGLGGTDTKDLVAHD
jgi:hypothetical protein